MAKHVRKRGGLHLSPRLREQEAALRPERPEPQPESGADRGARYHVAKTRLFAAVMAGISVITWILPLRPTHSDMEQRDLARFPEFSWQALISGDYFDGISLWFSDTFPARESLIRARGSWEKLYGLHSMKIYGPNTPGGDVIPDASTAPSHATLPSIDYSATTTGTSDSSGTGSTGTSSAGSTASTAPLPTRPTNVPGDGQITELGNILVVGNRAYEYYNFSKGTADSYIAAINHAAQTLSGRAVVYDMIVPTSTDVMLPEEIRQQINCSDQKRAIDYMYSGLSGAYAIPVQDTLRQHNNEYLYFYTDHHWTSLGAYYAYEKFMTMKGITPHALTDYKTETFDGFLGSFYASTQDAGLKTNEDTVYAYRPLADADMYFENSSGERTDWPVIMDVSSWSARYKYNTFIGGDNAFTCIRNHDLSDGSSIIVVKESFGNAFVPFLADHYETVYVVDYRYYEAMSLQQLVQTTGAREVLFLNNISATRNEALVGYIGDLVTR